MTISTATFPKLSYLKEGKGPALVLLHGFPENSGLWAQVMPGLALSYTVIAPDLPGAGDSELPGQETSMEELAECLHEILKAEQVGSAVIAGHSMGGYVALAFAEKYPEKVKGLSLIHSIASADSEEKKESRKKSADLIRKGGKEPFIKQMIPNLFSPTFKAAHPSVIEEQVKRGMELAADSMIVYTEAMMNRPDRTAILENAPFPVQFIAGADDSLIPPKTALKQSTLSSRNFVSLYNDIGHMSMIEDAGRLAKDIKEFAAYCYTQ